MNREFIKIDPKWQDSEEFRDLASYGGSFAATLTWGAPLWQSQAIVILAESFSMPKRYLIVSNQSSKANNELVDAKADVEKFLEKMVPAPGVEPGTY